MKKYRLLKDLPGLKKETIFEDSGNGWYVPTTKAIDGDLFYKFNYSDIKSSQDWFEEIKEVKYPLNWRAEKDGLYAAYWIADGVCASTAEKFDAIDENNYAIGNYYQTKEEADKALKQKKAYIEYIRLIEKLNEGWKPNWRDTHQNKYSAMYFQDSGEIDCGAELNVQTRPNCEYFRSVAIFPQLINQLGEEKIKLALGFE